MNNNYGTQNNNGQALAIASTTLGVMSLGTFCVPWFTLVLAGAGLTCGIISWVKAKKTGSQITLPVIGSIVSGVAFLASAVLVIAYHIAFSKIDTQWGMEFDKMDSTYRSMYDSLQQWDSQYDYNNLPEADSTFFIDR